MSKKRHRALPPIHSWLWGSSVPRGSPDPATHRIYCYRWSWTQPCHPFLKSLIWSKTNHSKSDPAFVPLNIQTDWFTMLIESQTCHVTLGTLFTWAIICIFSVKSKNVHYITVCWWYTSREKIEILRDPWIYFTVTLRSKYNIIFFNIVFL